MSAVANGDRVLAVAPSHAAVDALAQAILIQWPAKVWGDPLRKIVRIGSELRVTLPAIVPFLPQKLENKSPGKNDEAYFHVFTCGTQVL